MNPTREEAELRTLCCHRVHTEMVKDYHQDKVELLAKARTATEVMCYRGLLRYYRCRCWCHARLLAKDV